METEIPNRTTNQLLIQFIPDAAVFTDTSFVITACNRTAATLSNFRQQKVLGLDLSLLIPASSETNTRIVSRKNAAFTQGIITRINKACKQTPVRISRRAIDNESINGGFLFIYKPVDQEQSSPKNSHSHLKTASVVVQKIENQYRWPSDDFLYNARSYSLCTGKKARLNKPILLNITKPVIIS
jgi:transcriptional regulator with PAS, ATPase and Fis domain